MAAHNHGINQGLSRALFLVLVLCSIQQLKQQFAAK